MDNDGSGIPGVVPRETIRVPAGAQSLRAVRAGTALCFSGQASASQGQGEPAGTLLRVLDEPGDLGNGSHPGGNLRPQGVSVDTVDSADGSRRVRVLVVLRAAPVRGGVLGAA